jgi:uncharacterized damage-inducible protein DinB
MKVLPFALMILLLSSQLTAAPQASAKAGAPAVKTPFQAEFLTNLADVEDKLVRLAEATPSDKFAWRPVPGVRSISEVYMHIAGGNYFLCTFVGVNAPPAAADLEKKFTKKADVVAELKRSFAHLRSAAQGVGELDKPVKMFGSQTTHRGVLTTVMNHLHEHLGQSIAYARMNAVTPPWSH